MMIEEKKKSDDEIIKEAEEFREKHNELNKVYKNLLKRQADAEIKEPTIMQDRVAVPVDKGTMTVKGTCYEDVLNILCRNGYATNIHTEPCKKNLSEIEHTIVFWKEPVKTD